MLVVNTGLLHFPNGGAAPIPTTKTLLFSTSSVTLVELYAYNGTAQNAEITIYDGNGVAVNVTFCAQGGGVIFLDAPNGIPLSKGVQWQCSVAGVIGSLTVQQVAFQ